MKLIVFCVAVILAGASSRALHAAPVRFAFEAEINGVSSGILFDSGIDFAAGDTIKGCFAFDPSPGDGSNPFSAVQPYNFTLDISGTVISSPEFVIRSWNDNAITDFPLANFVDDMWLVGAGFGSSHGMSVANIDPALSGFTMSLLGPSVGPGPPLGPPIGSRDVFSQAHIPAFVETWNALDFERQLSVSLRDGTGGAIGFGATVGSFTLVPEPSSYCMGFSGLLTLATVRVRKGRILLKP